MLNGRKFFSTSTGCLKCKDSTIVIHIKFYMKWFFFQVSLILNTPSTRFLSYTCSYITFLCMIVLGKIQFSNMWVSLGCDETAPFTYVFIALIFMWIIGKSPLLNTGNLYVCKSRRHM